MAAYVDSTTLKYSSFQGGREGGIMSITIEYHCTEFLDFSSLAHRLEVIRKEPLPIFETVSSDLSAIEKAAKPYRKYKDIVVIGNGGSITSVMAYAGCLPTSRRLHIVDSEDPDFLSSLKRKLTKKDTLVIAVSKSGNTVQVIEELLFFKEYDKVVVTEKTGSLYKIAQKAGIPAILHEPIGGRYSGRTASAFFPAAVLGLDIKAIDKGAISMYKKCQPKVILYKNPALKFSSVLFLLDWAAHGIVFFASYSPKLHSFFPLVRQLIHESSGKDGKGQFITGGQGQELQHHTGQRLFGGKKDVMIVFQCVKSMHEQKLKVHVPPKLAKIPVRDGLLKDINSLSYQNAITYEFIGAEQRSLKEKIPHAVITIDKVEARGGGGLLGFYHYVAVYSSLLRGVDPYDQPDVEWSKELSYQMRKKR